MSPVRGLPSTDKLLDGSRPKNIQLGAMLVTEWTTPTTTDGIAMAARASECVLVGMSLHSPF
jgi:hypothetical protein